MKSNSCSLCSSLKTNEFYSFRGRAFYKCEDCNLIFQSKESFCSNSEEKDRYLDHNNSDLSDGYRKFLYNIIDPIKAHISIDENGLDFGSGPYPMMAKLLEEESYSVDSYDPYFSRIDLSSKKYNFIILCEVIEHFNKPSKELSVIKELLKPEGFLFIQTSLFSDSIDFEKWYYKDDITHVSFFSDETIDFICLKYGFKRILGTKKNIVILQLEDI